MAVCLAAAGTLAACGSTSAGSTSSTSGSSGGSKAPITLGFIGDLTGLNASVFGDSGAAAQARINVQNAEGGVDGHKLKLVVEDTQSSNTVAETAANLLISKHVFGIGIVSAFGTQADVVINKAGIPETGLTLDAHYGMAPYRNWFAIGAPTNVGTTKTVVSGTMFKFLRSKGATKWADLSWGGIPSVTDEAIAYAKVAPRYGVNVCLLDDSVPIGTVDFTPEMLMMKERNCNSANGSWSDASSVGFEQSLKDAGLAKKVLDIQPTGYDTHVLTSPSARASFTDAYVQSQLNFTTPNAATRAMSRDLAKYVPGYKYGDIPDVGAQDGWLSMDLMIFGLEHAGNNPTAASFIDTLRSQTLNYTAGGVEPSPTNYTHFGTDKEVPAQSCEYFLQLQAKGFVPAGPNEGKVCAPNYVITTG